MMKHHGSKIAPSKQFQLTYWANLKTLPPLRVTRVGGVFLQRWCRTASTKGPASKQARKMVSIMYMHVQSRVRTRHEINESNAQMHCKHQRAKRRIAGGLGTANSRLFKRAMIVTPHSAPLAFSSRCEGDDQRFSSGGRKEWCVEAGPKRIAASGQKMQETARVYRV